MPDQATPQADGNRRVFFFQRLDRIPVYANKGLAVSFNAAGQATNIIGRRRPLLARSRYALRTLEQAWQALTRGEGRTFYVDYLTPEKTSDRSRFVAVELAYAETEVVSAQQLMQPYYIFRAENGLVLFVPAIADAYVK